MKKLFILTPFAKWNLEFLMSFTILELKVFVNCLLKGGCYKFTLFNMLKDNQLQYIEEFSKNTKVNFCIKSIYCLFQVLELINSYPNICNQLHLPAQSGSTEVLAAMRRGYTREAYIELCQRVRAVIPGVYHPILI